MKEEWFDWILIKWEYANSDIQYVPAKVMQILDLRCIDGKIADDYEPGIYLCIISLKRSTKKVGKSHVIYKGAYERMENHKICFRIVEISSVHSCCFAVPDCATLEDKDILECDQWLFVENCRDWASSFSIYSMTSVIDLLNGWKLMLIILLRHWAGTIWFRMLIKSPSVRGTFESGPGKYSK